MKFEDLDLNKNLLKGLKEINFDKLTKVQEKTVNNILENKDILAIAKTGSGKTGAFGIPILELLINNKNSKRNNDFPEFLILAPTRELVSQIEENILDFSKYLEISCGKLCGDQKEEEIINLIKIKPKILVATPNKLFDLVEEDKISLKNIKYFVLDEFDKLLESGSSFYVKKVIKRLPKKRQNLFFSATFEEKTKEILNSLNFKFPQIIEEGADEIFPSLISQFVLFTKKEHKYKLLLEILQKKKVKSSIIFTNSKKEADNLVRFLSNNGMTGVAFHSQKSNAHREKVINNVKSGKSKILIATDLASRGLDIENFTHVFNFEIPTSPKTYLHRIGRVGRFDKVGESYSFCSASEREFLRKIECLIGFELIEIKHDFQCNFSKNAQCEDSKPKFDKKKTNFKKNQKESKFSLIIKDLKKKQEIKKNKKFR